MAREYNSRRGSQNGGGFSQVVWVFAAFVLGYVTAEFYDMASLSRLVDRMQDKPVASKSAAVKPQVAEIPKPKFEFYTLLTKDKQGNIQRVTPSGQGVALAKQNAPVKSGPSSIVQTAKQNSSQTLTATSTLKPLPVIATSKPIEPIVSQPRISQPIMIQPKSAVAVKSNFLIQIAAFNRREDAESLKASLLLKGYDASVVAYAQPGTHWFRVVIGPYQSKTEVNSIQTSLLQRHHIRGIIRQMSG